MKRLMAIIALMGTVHNAWAVGGGGFANQVAGTKAMGMANAFSAVADDASAVFFNPAGLTQLDGGEVTVGVAPMFPSSEYKTSGQTTKMDSFTPVVPNFYVAKTFAERWAVGFGMFSVYGLRTLWPNNNSFSYVTTESDLRMPEFSPTVAYQATDRLSFGMGVIYTRGDATLKSAFPVEAVNVVELGGTPAGAPDGESVLKGDGDGYGVNMGVLYQPNESHALALTWRSEIKVNLDGTVKITGLSNDIAALVGGSEYSTDVKTSVTLPPSVTVGYAFKKEALTWGVDAEWIGFSSYRTTDLTFADESILANDTTRHEFKDAVSFGTGVNYKLNETWQVRGGYSFYPRVSTEALWDPSVPDSDTHGLHVGGSWMKGSVGVDLSYSYLRYNNITIDNEVGMDLGQTVNGKYKTAASIVSANVKYRF